MTYNAKSTYGRGKRAMLAMADRPSGIDFPLLCPTDKRPCTSLCAAYRDSRESLGYDLALRADPLTSGRCSRFDLKVGAAVSQGAVVSQGGVAEPPAARDLPAVPARPDHGDAAVAPANDESSCPGARHHRAERTDRDGADDRHVGTAGAEPDDAIAPTVDDLRDEARAEQFAEESRARGLELS